MGTRGPVPKRSDQRRRNNKPVLEIAKAPGSRAAWVIPAADPKWHPIARSFYEALQVSGQAKFFEPSDWAAAFLITESMSRDLMPQAIGIAEKTGEVMEAVIPLKGASLAAYLRGFSVLLVTEGDRRRLSVELQRSPGPDPDKQRATGTVVDLRRRLAGGS